MLTTFLDVWDRFEQALVSLPFGLQIVVMLIFGVPAFFVTALVVERVADLLVRVMRTIVQSESEAQERANA